jgi:D-glycero-alpha-D-manno-heptose-7-phosphate kinase
MSFVTVRVPFRISFFGGGTDYPAWYLKEEGAVLSTSIDKYCYITCRQLPSFFSVQYRVVWSHIENASSISEILHPAVREGLRMMGFTDQNSVEIHHFSDLPARSGMGSSSAFANAIVLALTTLQESKITPEELYRKALELEQDRLNENVGSQDQVATAVGGFNIIRFNADSITVSPVSISAERQSDLESCLMLFFTGTTRTASQIAGQVIASIPNKTSELRIMRQMVDEAYEILKSDRPIDDFGALLHETWCRKKLLNHAISNEMIDRIYDKAMKAGAIGGKLLGAGSAGFMLFFVPPQNQASVRDSLDNLLEVPFQFETSGASILHNLVVRQNKDMSSPQLSSKIQSLAYG